MASGLVVQKGTALGKQTIFASLRQDLIRRLLHVSDHFGVKEQMKIVEDFTQSLANSGHRYSFAKSVILQALTRFKTMKNRSRLHREDPRYLPLYRNRWYDFDRRCKIKKTLGRTWYTGKNFGDFYKQEWKRRMKRKGGRMKNKASKADTEPPSTVMFVPSTRGGMLLNMLESLESDLWKSGDATWSVKLVEKSGKQLRHLFNLRMPILKGCPLGSGCKLCDNDAVKCTCRGVVYLAECKDCHNAAVVVGGVKEELNISDSWYVGETSRPLRMRVKEHWSKLEDLNTDSFMLTHWMRCHGLKMTPPEYTFKVLGSYSDCLSRQIAEAIHIEEKGILNKRSEFGINHLPRLEAVKSERDRDVQLEKEAREKANLVSDLMCFINVVKNVSSTVPTNCPSYRSEVKRRDWPDDQDLQQGKGGSKRQKTSMLASTPIWEHRKVGEGESSPDSIDTSSLLLDFSGGSFGHESCKTPSKGWNDINGQGLAERMVTAGLTPDLKKLLIRPVEENDYMSTKRLLEETINLTRAAILKGLIDENLNMEDFSIKLTENAFYKALDTMDPVQRMLDNLDLSDWKQDDLEDFEILHRPMFKARRGLFQHLQDAVEIFQNEKYPPGVITFASKAAPCVLVDQHVENFIMDSARVSMVISDEKKEDKEVIALRKDVKMDSTKRKFIISPNNSVAGQAYKLQRGDQIDIGSSPALKIRSGLDTKPKSPPAGGDLSSPAIGRIRKVKRRFTTPKRSFTPDKRQTLITSVFSPRENKL